MAEMPVGFMPSAELKKLTVQQLKSICKGKGLTGYSKLAKDAIILKLVQWNSTHPSSSHPASGTDQENGYAMGILSTCRLSRTEANIAMEVPPHDSAAGPTNSAASQSRLHTHTKSSGASGSQGAQDSASYPLQTSNSGTCVGGLSPTHSGRVIEEVPKSTKVKRGLPKDIAGHNAGQRSKISCIATNGFPAQARVADSVFKLPPLPSRHLTSEVAGTAMGPDKRAPTRTSFVTVSHGLSRTIKPAAAKRFKLLTTGEISDKQTAFAGILDAASLCFPDKPLENSSCLEFPVEPVVDLKQITFPPAILKRKQARQFSILLSGISFSDLLNCSLVSRMFRYSAHLSAYHRLKREYPGRRTEIQIGRSNPSMTNMWPCLLQRQQEVSTRKTIYSESFLNKAVGEWYTLRERLWASPDNPKQATVAIRFILSRFYFQVSVLGVDHPDAQRKHKVVGCQEIIPDEIWMVSIDSLGAHEEYYILEPTCEVIGCQEKDIYNADRHPMQQIILRADWSSYISECLEPGNSVASIPLFERVKWANHEEYDKGISKHWLKKMGEEGVKGDAQVQIAKRYILACVVPNSISGKWMSSVEMAQEFAGLPNRGYGKCKPRKQVQLYIPGHHYVESIHLVSTKKRPLHVALAVVQTPGREYFILRDNGMQVGCEEDGISTIWMSILGCHKDGTVIVVM